MMDIETNDNIHLLLPWKYLTHLSKPSTKSSHPIPSNPRAGWIRRKLWAWKLKNTSLATFFSDSGENYTNEDLRITHDITSGVISWLENPPRTLRWLAATQWKKVRNIDIYRTSIYSFKIFQAFPGMFPMFLFQVFPPILETCPTTKQY